MASKPLETLPLRHEWKVMFHPVLRSYPHNENLICKYSLNNFKPQDDDRIAIFKVGFKTLKDFVVFEWTRDFASIEPRYVIFNSEDLPIDPKDNYYQFCYVTRDNVMEAISEPFQFCTESVEFCEKPSVLKQIIANKDEEIKKLREENEIFKRALAAITDRKEERCDKDIASLTQLVKVLTVGFAVHHDEIDKIKGGLIKERSEEEVRRTMTNSTMTNSTPAGLKDAIRKLGDFHIDDLKPMPPFPFDFAV